MPAWTPRRARPRSPSASRSRPRAAPSGTSMLAGPASFAPRSMDVRRRPATRNDRADMDRHALRTTTASPTTAMRRRRSAICDPAQRATLAIHARATETGCPTTASRRGARRCLAIRWPRRAARSRRRVTSSKRRRDAGRWGQPSWGSRALSTWASDAAAALPVLTEHVARSAGMTQTARAGEVVYWAARVPSHSAACERRPAGAERPTRARTEHDGSACHVGR